jgi:hypothetical protein
MDNMRRLNSHTLCRLALWKCERRYIRTGEDRWFNACMVLHAFIREHWGT